METETLDGSEIVETVPDEASQSNVNSNKFSELVEEVFEAEAVVNGASNMTNEALDVEENISLTDQIDVHLEEELLHTKENEEESVLLKKMLNKALKEREDALKEQEGLKAFELEATMLIRSFSESASDVIHFKDDSNLLDQLEEIIKYALAVREKEVVMQDQFANTELKAKGLEDKLDMQSKRLEEEIKIRTLKEDELDNAKVMSCRFEIDLKCVKEKFLDLEGQLKYSMDESEEYKKLAGQNEECCVKSFERALELGNLLLIFESRNKEMEQLVTSLQKETSGIYQKLGSNEHTQEPLNETEMELVRVEEQPVHSNNGSEHEEKTEDTLVSNKELKTALLASRQKEQELQEALIVAEDRISSYGEMERSSTSRIFELENLTEILQGILKDAQEKTGTLELDLKNISKREIPFQTRLEDSEAKLLAQESFVRYATIRSKEIEQLLELQANDAESMLTAAKENYAHADTEVKKLSEKLNLLEDHVKEFDDQASHAYTSEIAKEIELQVLYGKLAEMDIIVQNLQKNVRIAETRAHGVEAEWWADLAKKNSKFNEEFANLQNHMDEIQTTLNQIDNEKQSVSYQLISTTKNINGLTRQLADERQHLQKQISTVVKENLDITKKYQNIKYELDTLLSEHVRYQKKSNEIEETITEKLDDLKYCRSPSTDMHVEGLRQKLQFDEEKSEQDATNSNSVLATELKDTKTECLSEHEAFPAPGSGSIANVDSAMCYLPDIRSMLIVVLVVVIGLVIGKLI